MACTKCSNNCSCVVTGINGVTVTGTGEAAQPYVVTADFCILADQVPQVEREGNNTDWVYIRTEAGVCQQVRLPEDVFINGLNYNNQTGVLTATRTDGTQLPTTILANVQAAPAPLDGVIITGIGSGADPYIVGIDFCAASQQLTENDRLPIATDWIVAENAAGVCEKIRPSLAFVVQNDTAPLDGIVITGTGTQVDPFLVGIDFCAASQQLAENPRQANATDWIMVENAGGVCEKVRTASCAVRCDDTPYPVNAAGCPIIASGSLTARQTFPNFQWTNSPQGTIVAAVNLALTNTLGCPVRVVYKLCASSYIAVNLTFPNTNGELEWLNTAGTGAGPLDDGVGNGGNGVFGFSSNTGAGFANADIGPFCAEGIATLGIGATATLSGLLQVTSNIGLLLAQAEDITALITMTPV